MALLIRALILLSVLGLTMAACGNEDATSSGQDDATVGQLSTDSASALGAETILHHWQALTAIHDEDIDAAIHHVEHIIDAVQGDHQTAMRKVLDDLAGERLHLAEHDIGEMLAGEAEPNLSPAMVHLQMAMAALSRDDRLEAVHHATHFVDVALDADATHGRAALEALRSEEILDAALHLSAAVRIEVERQQLARRCSGDGAVHPAVRGGRIAVLLVIDEEWADRHDELAEEHAESVVARAQDAVADLAIVIDVVDVQRWESPGDGDLHELSHAASIDNPLPEGASLLLVLTDQDTDGATDGVHSHSTGSHAIAVRHHADQPHLDALVFVHEIGHMLDLIHAAGTYMQARGFVNDPQWSDCQQRAVDRLMLETTS